jgi:hypothetical protein
MLEGFAGGNRGGREARAELVGQGRAVYLVTRVGAGVTPDRSGRPVFWDAFRWNGHPRRADKSHHPRRTDRARNRWLDRGWHPRRVDGRLDPQRIDRVVVGMAAR